MLNRNASRVQRVPNPKLKEAFHRRRRKANGKTKFLFPTKLLLPSLGFCENRVSRFRNRKERREGGRGEGRSESEPCSMRRSQMSTKEGRNEGGKGGLTNSGDISTSMRMRCALPRIHFRSLCACSRQFTLVGTRGTQSR